MNKSLLALSVILVILGMVGCEMNQFDKHSIYFYALAGDGDADSEQTIKYRSDGHTIIMSRGEEGKVLTEGQATTLKSQTGFTLTLDGNSVTPAGFMSVDELGDTGYHVVQSFPLGVMTKGLHTLVGVTNLIKEGGTRTNKVTLTVK